MSTGSDALSGQAETLQSAVSFFKVGETHEQSYRPAAAPPRKALLQKGMSVRLAAAGKPKPGSPGGTYIEIGSDSQDAEHHDKDFTIFQ
jgi:hypothetical protein